MSEPVTLSRFRKRYFPVVAVLVAAAVAGRVLHLPAFYGWTVFGLTMTVLVLVLRDYTRIERP